MQQQQTSDFEQWLNNAPRAAPTKVTRTFNVEQDHNHIHGGWNTEIYVPPALPLQRSRALTPADGVGADDAARPAEVTPPSPSRHAVPHPSHPGYQRTIHPGADEMRDAAMVSDVHSMLQMLEVSQVEQEDGDQMRDSGG